MKNYPKERRDTPRRMEGSNVPSTSDRDESGRSFYSLCFYLETTKCGVWFVWSVSENDMQGRVAIGRWNGQSDVTKNELSALLSGTEASEEWN